MGINKTLDSIKESDLASLVENKVSEKKTIEYKIALPGNTRDEKKEFLADVSSFANAAGGDLIFGIKEEGGVPLKVCGLGNIDYDAAILRLENMIRDNIDPRITGIATRPILLQGSNAAIIIRVPRSWAQPHVVGFENHWRFYSRDSAGKHPLDVSEVKAAFALSASIAERIRLFRAERLGKIIASETPIALSETPKVILHLVPFGAFEPAHIFDLSSPGNCGGWERLVPMDINPAHAQRLRYRYNLDGILTYIEDRPNHGATYLQLFRNGTIEAVAESTRMAFMEQSKVIDPVRLESTLLDALAKYLGFQKRLGVDLPLFVMLSLLGVSNYCVMPNERDAERLEQLNADFAKYDPSPIDRDSLLLPDVMVDSYESDLNVILKPIFDALWNAGGWPRSYRADGKQTKENRQ
jgi:hypothetical protein